MSGKSRRSRSRRLSQCKKRRGRQSSLTRAAQQQTIAQTDKIVSRSSLAAPATSVPTAIAAATGAQYSYVVTELRRIGILAGIVLVILVVLALILS